MKALKDVKQFKTANTAGGQASAPMVTGAASSGEAGEEVAVEMKPSLTKSQAQSWSSGVSNFCFSFALGR